ncbi:MAG TPA: hypothetical protein VIS73_00150 [Rhodocyclaceae bacterium]
MSMADSCKREFKKKNADHTGRIPIPVVTCSTSTATQGESFAANWKSVTADCAADRAAG